MTKIVNLFAGPGAGKSTTAAGLFYLMKLKGMNVELATEYAKDLTWSERYGCLAVQPLVFGKQLSRLERLIGKVDFIITDSPILLSVIYNSRYPTSFSRSVTDIFNSMPNINFYLDRKGRKYNPKGRSQTLEESKGIDLKIHSLLLDLKVPFTTILSGKTAARKIFKATVDK
jgi:hypothetical protein